MAEERIVREVRAALEKDTRINLHRYPITATLQSGDLILAGEVEDITAKKRSLLAASETQGVRRIVDRLTVAPAEKMGDAEIRDHVGKVLLEEAALERCIIRHSFTGQVKTVREALSEPTGYIVIEVKDGVVTLNGEVPSLTHKRLAGVLAWWVPGTRDVINGLEEGDQAFFHSIVTWEEQLLRKAGGDGQRPPSARRKTARRKTSAKAKSQ